MKSSSGPFVTSFQPGWNLFAMPFSNLTTFTLDNPGSVLSCFSYNPATGSYVAQTFTQAAFQAAGASNLYTGYWVFCSGPVQLTVNGDDGGATSTQTELATGWNLVGTPASSDLASTGLQFSSESLASAATASLLGPQAFTYSTGSGAYQALSYSSGVFPAFQAAWVFAFNPGLLSTGTSGTAPGGTVFDGVSIFPADNPWNTDISGYPVDPNSANYMASMNASTTNLHPDFGSNLTYGIPFTVVTASQPFVPMDFVAYADQSDPGPYPFPPNAPVEGGAGSKGDRHVLVVDAGNNKLYETYNSFYTNPGWTADNGAVFDLTSDALRPDTWTSADAAGLPIFAGLAKYDECTAGVITHALRFTVGSTQAGFIHPATHHVGSSLNLNLPPMGLRVRLKASFDTTSFTGNSLVILTGLKKYGMFVADIGSDWFISGGTDARWDDNDLNQLKSVPASSFEVVQTGTILR